jgi:hypothetical protein
MWCADTNEGRLAQEGVVPAVGFLERLVDEILGFIKGG